MAETLTVDFHVHSTASDGTLTPADLAAKTADFAAVALTDHDNCEGAAEFLAGVPSTRCRRFAGIELSIEPGEGFDQFHLLGLGIDFKNAALQRFLRRILEGRNARNARIIANFQRRGMDMAGIDQYAHGEVLARPHFARWLVDHHCVRDIKEAFVRYLAPDSPPETRCFEERWRPTQVESFAVIHAAGGVAVMAHPKYWIKEWQRVGCDFAKADRALAVLREKGLDGIEALYAANTMEENVTFTRLAIQRGYLLSAGSDFHGANKQAIALGMRVNETFIRPLLDRLTSCP